MRQVSLPANGANQYIEHPLARVAPAAPKQLMCILGEAEVRF
jgi:hypothetical protein